MHALVDGVPVAAASSVRASSCCVRAEVGRRRRGASELGAEEMAREHARWEAFTRSAAAGRLTQQREGLPISQRRQEARCILHFFRTRMQ
jgi:hypothetical protein